MARYTSKHTGKKIDDTIDNVVNPNLLDNWYFANPVNQRGQTSYTGENIYSIDRWKIYNATYNVDTGELISNGSFGQINQITDKYEDMACKTVTLSILFDSLDDGWSVRLHNDDKFITIPTGDKLFTHTYVYPYDDATRSLSLCLISHVSGSKCKPIAVKLELGTTQTLAHQDENGNWVLNEIPDFGEQLRRCQRYYYNSRFGITANPNGAYAITLDNASSFLISTYGFPVTMRTTPSIKIYSFKGTENRISYWASGADVTDVTATVNEATVGASGFNCVASSSTLGANTYAFHIVANAEL